MKKINKCRVSNSELSELFSLGELFLNKKQHKKAFVEFEKCIANTQDKDILSIIEDYMKEIETFI